MTTIKPTVLIKFDYNNFGKTKITPQVMLMRRLMAMFGCDILALTSFLEKLIDAVTSDFGVVKSFYDVEWTDEEEDRLDDDPSSKTIPMSELSTKSVAEFIRLLQRNGRKKNVTDRYVKLGKHMLQMQDYYMAVQGVVDAIAGDCLHIIKAKDEFPVVEVDDSVVTDLISQVNYDNLRRVRHRKVLRYVRDLMKESSMRQYGESHAERFYHHKMIALKTMDGGVTMIEESRKRIVDDSLGLSFNFVAFPSFSTSYNYTGINIWDSVNSLSKIKLIRCLVPEKST